MLTFQSFCGASLIRAPLAPPLLSEPLKDAADAQDKTWSGYQSAYDAHMDSANKSKSEATLSLVTALAAVGYGYYIGVFSEEE